MLNQQNIAELNKITKQMVAPGKGILAADESTGTIGKRFEKINLPNEEPNRRAYREMLFTAPGIGDYISGVIMFDETIRQSSSDGKTFISILQEAGVLPGIKVDTGTIADPASVDEKLTKGLEGLPERLEEYVVLGAKFAKWRSVITITPSIPPLEIRGGEGGLPTDANIRRNAKDLAVYALECQKAGLVPMVEPEVLMDGNHTMEKCEEVSEKVLAALFEELKNIGVAIEGTILKTNMAIPAKGSGQKATPERIAEATVRLFKKVLPDKLPGEAFLSGGQSEIEATENLNAISQLLLSSSPSLPHQPRRFRRGQGGGKGEWRLSFSYGRALQESALKLWNGKAENVKLAQEKFLHRAKMNSLATLGKYDKSLEK